MAMRVDQARDQGAPASVDAELSALRGLLALRQKLPHPSVVADHHRSEADDLAFAVERVAVHIVDQHIGEGRRR